MNVYVESDFVLTFALLQDDHQATRQIIHYAQEARITLKLSTFS